MSLWEKMRNEDGETFLKKLEEMAEKNNGVFNIAKVLSDVYGLNDEEIKRLNVEMVKYLDSNSVLKMVRGAHEALGMKPTLGSVLLLTSIIGALVDRESEVQKLKESDKIEEVRKMAGGRLLLVREELDDADIYIVHVPKRNVFEELLKSIPIEMMLRGEKE